MFYVADPYKNNYLVRLELNVGPLLGACGCILMGEMCYESVKKSFIFLKFKMYYVHFA